VICLRDAPPVPVTELFEAELDILELLAYKPIMSKGYQCMMHIHTVSDEVQIKELLRSFEKNEKGDVTEKEMPKFVKAHTKLICRISTRIPVPLEKHDVLPQLGRFTLRDEGRTIAVGKILKYKPANAVALAAVGSSGAKKEEVKTDGGPKPTTTSA